LRNPFRRRSGEGDTPTPKKKYSLGRRIWRFVWKSTMWFFIITISWVILYKWINPPITFLQIREWVACDEGCEFSKEWVDLEDISLHMRLAVVASEDNNFMKHGGIDWGAVEKAKKYNETIGLKKGKKRGASTITMQTAKNVFLWPGRNFIRKGLEVYFTYLIEFFWSKDRIMEVYLNVIEMGPAKFGVQAAAQDYFGTTAAKLTRQQAALIAGALPNPKKFNPGKPSKYLAGRRDKIMHVMSLIGNSYFERYGSEVSSDVREKEEKKMKEKIESLPETDDPTVIEEEVVSKPEEPVIEPEVVEPTEEKLEADSL
jgi:monofunctional biosynthetic peptidoglycan transglycosylase